MRTLAVAAITGLIALAMAGVASAAPSVSMIWTATTGSGTVGGSSIDAAVGDTLTLDMRIVLDPIGAQVISMSYDIGTAGVAAAYTRLGIDSVNDLNFLVWDFQASSGNLLTQTPATYTGGSLEYLAGTGITCPGPPAVGNVFAGQCGQFATGLLGAAAAGVDLGGGIIGSFRTNVGATTEPVITLAQAQFEVVPEPATGGLLALGLGALAFIGRRRA